MHKSEEIRHITPDADPLAIHLKRLWRYRSLIWLFAKRDLKVKYSQTLLGLGWTVIQPLTGLLIFTLFFGYLLEWKAGELPYALYVFSGLLGWNFFAFIASAGSQSILDAANIIKKIYVPKGVFPLSKVLYGAVELSVSLVLLLGLILFYGQSISSNFIFVPFALLYNIICGLLLVFWVGALAYKRQDVFHVLPFVLYFGIWLTPVFFTDSFIPEKFRSFLLFNPMANVVDIWRWVIFGYGEFSVWWLLNFSVSFCLMLAGLYLFVGREDEFSDYV